jgi:hypothetical protein
MFWNQRGALVRGVVATPLLFATALLVVSGCGHGEGDSSARPTSTSTAAGVDATCGAARAEEELFGSEGWTMERGDSVFTVGATTGVTALAAPRAWRVGIVGLHDAHSAAPRLTQARLLALLDEVALFFRDASAGRLEVSTGPGRVFGPVEVGDVGSLEQRIASAVRGAGVRLEAFDAVIAVGEVHGAPSWGSPIAPSLAWASPAAHHVAHQLGHQLGLGHARRAVCAARGVGAARVIEASDCRSDERGDGLSVMGALALGQPSAFHKLKAGLLSEREVPEVTESGVFALSPLEAPSGLLRGLRLPWGRSTLSVEYRVSLPAGASEAPGSNSGAVLHRDADLLQLEDTSSPSAGGLVLHPGAPALEVKGVASLRVLRADRALAVEVTLLPPVADLRWDGREEGLSGIAPWSSRLSWTGTGTCTLSEGGLVPSEGFRALDLEAGLHVFELECSNTVGVARDVVRVEVNSPSRPPSVTLSLNGQESDASAYAGEPLTVAFTSRLATHGCVRTGAWSGPSTIGAVTTEVPRTPGARAYGVRCANPLGVIELRRTVVVLTPPTVALQRPARARGAMRGALELKLAVSDWAAVDKVELVTAGGPVPVIEGVARLDTSLLPDGVTEVRAVARRLDGALVASRPLSLQVDNTPPHVVLREPSSGRVGKSVTLRASGSDARSAVTLQLLLDGQPVGAPRTASTRVMTWDIADLPHGNTYRWQARATDAAGNSSVTAPAVLTVDKVAPALTTPLVGEITPTSATVRWRSSEPTETSLRFGAHSRSTRRTLPDLRSEHAVLLEALEPATQYTVRIKARDRAGNAGTAVAVTFRTADGPAQQAVLASARARTRRSSERK